MNRFHKAWLALTGRLEPEVRVVCTTLVGEPHMATLYCVQLPDKDAGYVSGYHGEIWLKRKPTYYTTCAQAHAEHPDECVSAVKAIKVGGDYVIASSLQQINVQPKPKRPKGVRNGRG